MNWLRDKIAEWQIVLSLAKRRHANKAKLPDILWKNKLQGLERREDAARMQ